MDTTQSTNSQQPSKASKTSSVLKKADKAVNVRNLGIALKLLLVILMVVLLVSVALNIYQAIENDCRNIDKKIRRLEEENDKLTVIKDSLIAAQEELNNTIDDFVEQNIALSSNLLKLKGEEEKLVQNLNALSDVDDALQQIVFEYETTFEDFETEVNNLISNLNNTSNKLNELISETNQTASEIDLVSSALAVENQVFSLITEAFNTVASETENLRKRDDFLDTFLFSEVFNDQELGFNNIEYSHLFQRIEDIFLEDNENKLNIIQQLQVDFPQSTLSYEEALALLNQLLAL